MDILKTYDDYRHLKVVGDLWNTHSLEYHLERCMGILLLIQMYLGEDVVPVMVGMCGVMPVVTVTIPGFNQLFQIWERQVRTKKGTMVRYVSNFDFSMFVETRAGIVGGDSFTMLV